MKNTNRWNAVCGESRMHGVEWLNISPHQLSYVTNSGEGEGLVFYGSTIIPFKDKFDNSLMLYALMTSKPDEVEKRKRLGIGERDEE